jgi:hypothetical protein
MHRSWGEVKARVLAAVFFTGTAWMSLRGPSRHLACALQSGRFQIKADIKRQAGPASSVENDPKRSFARVSLLLTRL